MRYRFICCEVFVREACRAIAASPHTVDPVFTPKASHLESDKLRKELQELIDGTDARVYDHILLGFGICGNSTIGLSSPELPLVIPRAHDCCTLFLGSKESFVNNFSSRLSAGWSSDGYMERGYEVFREDDKTGVSKEYDELVAQYGEDNAQYIWETLHPQLETELIYISMAESAHLGNRERMEKEAAQRGLPLCVLEGNDRLIRALAAGDWNEDEFLVLQPKEKIGAVYDNDSVVKAVSV